MSTNIHIASSTPAKSKAQEERERKELEARKKLEEQADKERKANTYEDGNNIVWVVNKETEAEYNRKKAKEKAAAKAASAAKAGTNTYGKGGTTAGKNGTTAEKNTTGAANTEKKPEKELSEEEFINKYLSEKFNQSLYYDEAQNARGNLNKAAEKKNYAAAVAKFREEAKKAFIARANGEIPDTAEATLKKSAKKAQKASSLEELRNLYANENKQAREEAARKEMLVKQQREKKAAEAQRKAGTSALEKAGLSKAVGGSSAAEFRQNRSEAMGKAAAGSAEGIKKIKDADLKKDIALEFQKIKYQLDEAGRRYDALSEEEKRALYRRHNSSALDRAGMAAEEGGLRSRTAQEARTALGQQIADRYYKLDEESRKLENASEYAFLNRMRSAAGAGVENLGLWLYDTFGYEPGKKVYEKGEARKIGEVTDRQVQLLADAAPSQLGKDLVKVSDSVAQQLSYKILTAPISMFGGSVVFDKAVSKGLSAAEAAKTAGKFSGGVYTGGMALSSAADKYVQCRSEGQGKLEASVRALGTGAISYFTESLGGIGGSKSPLNGLEEKYAESIIGSILYNAFEEGGEEFLEYSADILLDGAVDLAARGEWQQEWDWAEVIENAKIGAMTGGLFGGYQKLGDIKEAVDRKIDAKKAAKLEKAVREYCDYMKNAYRLMSDPNLRKIAERQIGDTTIPAATRMNRSETGEMNFGDVLPKRAGEVSFEQMYGTKPPDGTENQSFEEWAAGKDAEKKQAAIDGEKVNALSLKERLTMIANNAFPKTLPHVKLGEMPEAVKATIGIDSDAPLVMSERKAYEVMSSKGEDKNAGTKKRVNWHNLGADGLEKVINALSNPLRAVKQNNGRYGFVVEIEKGGTPYYAIVEIEAEGNYRGKMEKTNVVVSAFGTNLNYVENQMAKGTELEIKKEPAPQVTHGRQLPYGVNETGSNGDVPSPEVNIPQNGSIVNKETLLAQKAEIESKLEKKKAKAAKKKGGTDSTRALERQIARLEEELYGINSAIENRAAQESADNNNLTNREKYSLSEQEVAEIKKGVSVITDADNNTIIDIKSNILENIPKEDWLARVKNVIRSAFSKGFSINGEHVDVSAKSRSEFTNSKDSAYLRDNESEIYADKMKTAPHLDIISQNVNYENEAANHDRTDNIMSFDRGKVELRIGGNEYGAEVIIGVREDGSKVFYDIVGMDANKKAAPIGSQSAQTANTEAQEPSDNISSNDSITDTSENFKSENENSAAKVQQAETEEEARLRTLYESEPEGTKTAAKTRRAPGTVSFEQMYGTKPPDGTENQSFEEWTAKKDAEKKKAAEGANHIKEQIRENQELLNTKEAAASVNVPLESVNDKRNIREWATRTLASSGYKAFNPELGTVIFDGQRINGAVKYLQTKAEFAAFAALPDVIAKGSVLAVHENHKGRDYGTYTIIAPIKINGQRGNMAVVVKKTSDNFYKVHRILAPDGRKFDIPDIKNSESTLRRGHTENDGAHANSIGSESNKSIPQNGNGVNTSDVKNSAAQTQQKNGKEVNAPGTEKSIGEDIGQKAQELIDKIKKRKADAEVTDEKLKGMSTKRQAEVLKERAEKAGIDMTPEELVDFAQSIGRIKGLFGSEFKDFARILDDASGRSEAIRNTLHELFERPFRQAQSQYTRKYKRAVEHISKKFSELGIKAGSKESAAVQRYGEGVYQVSKNGETKPYTEEMLKRDFPESWEKIEEAAKYCRTVYDYYLKNLNEMYEKIYPNTLEKAKAYKNKVREKSVREFKKAGQLGKYARSLEANLEEKKKLLSSKKSDTKAYIELQSQIANLEARIKSNKESMEALNTRAFADKARADLLQAQIDNGDVLKNKQIKPRKDYFHHFQELEGDFAQIVDIMTNDQNISPELIGKSANTKPKTIWTGIAQERAKVHGYKEDAVGGMLKYIQTAETLLAYDPLVAKLRDTSSVIRTAGVIADKSVKGTGTNAAELSTYIDLWANNIAGKSYGLDRWVFDAMGDKGRAAMKAVDKINGNVKSSMVMANINTALKQISNLPNATAYIPNPVDWAKGAAIMLKAKFGKDTDFSATRAARGKSSFMNERYLDNEIEKLTNKIAKEDILSKPYKKFEQFMLEAGDRAVAELIWYTAYNRYMTNPDKAIKHMGRLYDGAIDYADDITRRSVAGRGRGETALAETSKLMGVFAPYQVETNNSYQLLKEQIGKKNAAGIAALQINTFLMNAAYKAVFGTLVLGFDFISATIDVIKEAFGFSDDDDEEKKDFLDIMKYAAGRYGGELLSGMPMGAQIAEFITAGDSDFADDFFGENNPAKFGNGIALISAGVKTYKAAEKARKGKADLVDVFDAASPLIGRRQWGRTAKGLQSMINGGVYGYDSDGNKYLKYLQGNSPADWAKAVLMGQYATDAGREYVDGGFKRLSVSDTEKMEAAFEMKVPKEKFYNAIMGMKQFGNQKDKQNYLFNNEELSADEKRIIDALYFGDKGKEAAAAARKDADMIGAKTNKNNFYDFLSGRLSSDRDYSNEDEFINSGYSGKIRGQIREAGEAHITREQLFEVISGTKGMKSGEKMKYIYSEDGFSQKQKDALAEIVLGDSGRSRRESYAAANISIEDRALVEGILSDYDKEKKASGSAEQDELNTRKYVMDKLMAQGKSEAEAYRLYKVQNGNWINDRYDLDEKEKAASAKAIKQYGLSMDEYIAIKNYSDMGQGEKDEYGNTISGSKKADAIKEIAGILGCGEEAARQKYAVVNECVYDVEELSSSARNKLKTAKEKYGWTDEKWLLAANAIKLSGATKKKEKIEALRDAGFSATEAAGYYNLSAGKDYYFKGR